jgi:hypothetical protein
MKRDVGGIGCGARGQETNAPPALGRRRGSATQSSLRRLRKLVCAGTPTPCEELADGGPRGLLEARKTRPPKRGRNLEPEARRNGTSESAARRRNDAAMARREAPHLRKEV